MKHLKTLFSAALAASLVVGVTSFAHAGTHIRACVVTVPKTVSFSMFDYNRDQILANQTIKCPTGTFKIADGLITFNMDLRSKERFAAGGLNVVTRNTVTSNGVPAQRNLLQFYAQGPGIFTEAFDANDYADGKTPLPSNNTLILDPTPGGTEYFQIRMSNPVVVKYRTDVTVRAVRHGHSIKIKIAASRNQIYGANLTSMIFGIYGQSLKMAVVNPKAKADRAIVRRDGKIIARLKLTKYGNGSVTVFDPTGKNKYSVTLVETPVNWRGQAKFIK